MPSITPHVYKKESGGSNLAKKICPRAEPRNDEEGHRRSTVAGRVYPKGGSSAVVDTHIGVASGPTQCTCERTQPTVNVRYNTPPVMEIPRAG